MWAATEVLPVKKKKTSLSSSQLSLDFLLLFCFPSFQSFRRHKQICLSQELSHDTVSGFFAGKVANGPLMEEGGTS